MLNKIYEWIETSFANLRNGVPAAEHPGAHGAQGDGPMRRKRTIEWYENVTLLLSCSWEPVILKRHRMNKLNIS